MGPAGLVGRVLDSWNGGSKVLLLVDPQSNVGVRVQPGLRRAASRKASRVRIACALDLDARRAGCRAATRS